MRRGLALVAALTCALGLSVQPALDAAPVTLADKAGFAPGSELVWQPRQDVVRELDAMAATGARWLRVPLQWTSIEPAPGVRRWSRHDALVRLAVERGLQPIAVVAYTPRWARPADCDSQFCPPADDQTYARFVAAVVRRYAPVGLRVVEIWNEPNMARFFRPRPDPARYTSLLRAAHDAAKAADGRVTVVSGGLAPASRDSDAKLTPLSFVEAMYDAGAGGAFDALGMHPYAWPAAPLHRSRSNAFYNLPRLHRAMTARGDGAKKIWMTEFGYSTGTWRNASSEAEQAEYLTQAYEHVAGQPWAGPLLWFNYRDRGSDPDDREMNFGLVTREWRAKPALEAFMQVIHRPAQ